MGYSLVRLLGKAFLFYFCRLGQRSIKLSKHYVFRPELATVDVLHAWMGFALPTLCATACKAAMLARALGAILP